MKKLFNPNENKKSKLLDNTNQPYLRIEGRKINFNSQLSKRSKLAFDNYVSLSYDEEIKTIYIEKTTDKRIGFKIRKQSNHAKHGCYIYARSFFDHFNIDGDIKKSYTVNTFTDNGFECSLIDKNIYCCTHPKKSKIPFVKLGQPTRLNFNKIAEKIMGLQQHDIVRLFYNPETRIVVIKKNDPQNINGLLVKKFSHKTQSRLYLRSKMMIDKFGWPEISERMELKRGGAGEDENAFYFELPKINS